MGSVGTTRRPFADGRVRHFADLHVVVVQRRLAAERPKGQLLVIATAPAFLAFVGRRRRLRSVHVVPLPTARRKPRITSCAKTLAALHYHVLWRRFRSGELKRCLFVIFTIEYQCAVELLLRWTHVCWNLLKKDKIFFSLNLGFTCCTLSLQYTHL